MKGTKINLYKNEKELRKNKYKKRFSNTKIKYGESLFLFINKLESLLKFGNPKHSVEQSDTLIEQFKMAVPTTTRKIIQGQII